MAEMLALPQYKLRYTLFRNSHFNIPVVYPIARLQLPKLSILHYVSTDGVTVGPQSSDQLFLTTTQLLYVDHVIKYENPIGSPMKAFSNPSAMITDFRRRNRSFRPLRKLDRLEQDTRATVVFNYSMLAFTVKYAASFRASWYMWRNIYAEVYANVNRLAEISVRQQFIEVNLPEVMPGLTQLREYASRQSADTLRKFRTPELKMIADIFMWSGDKRETSLLGAIDPKHYDKVNLLVRRLNGWVTINLGWLDKMRSDRSIVEGDDEATIKEKVKGLEPKMFGLRVLKLFNMIHQATTPIATATADEIIAEPLVEIDTLDAIIDESHAGLGDEDPQSNTEELLDDDKELAALEKELDELDKLKEMAGTYEEVDESGDVLEYKPIDVDALIARGKPPGAGHAMVAKADEMASKGQLTAAEHRRLVKLSTVFENLPNPYGGEGTYKEAMVLHESDLLITPDKLTNDDVVLDKSLTESRVDVMERQYIQKVLKKDILRCVSSMQRGAVAVTGYTVDRYTDAVNDRETHVIKLTPAIGMSSTVKIPLPVIKEDGTFLYNGTINRMRKQRSDLPIRKVSPTRVALSSYYAKVFVERSERTKFSYGKWLLGQLVIKCRDRDDPHISKAVLSKCVNYKANLPLAYTTIAQSITSFDAGKYELFFDYSRRVDKLKLTADDLKHEKDGWVICGKYRKQSLIMATNGMIYAIQDDGSQLEINNVEGLTGIETDPLSTPTFMAEMKIYSKVLPVGFCLAYLLGLEGLLKVLKVKPRRVVIGEKLNLQPEEYVVRFKNESLVFKRDNVYVSLLMSGFNLYHSTIRAFDIELFNDRDVYAAVLDREGTGARYLRELDSMNIFFVDPMTEDLLKWMGEPTTFNELLLRATQMLVNEVVKTRREDKNQIVEGLERIRGYERVAGIVYETLSKAMRAYNARVATGKSSVQVNPNDAVNAIIHDPTTAPVNNINPIHSLREREVITFGGRGGRSRRAMVAAARLFTEEDMGLISEGTVDSGDVAIITYLSPNANLTSTRGTVRMYDKDRDGSSSIMSTAALLSFNADGDDPKRINFITVQHGHGISTEGSEVQGARTGVERVIASRMGPEFAVTADEAGEVTELAADSIAVTYKNGDVKKYPLGLIHTNAEGTLYPQTLKSGLKLGDKVAKFDVVTYNSGFFKPSLLDARRVDYMNGCIGRIALREATYTVEDSSSLSVKFAMRMSTLVSKLKTVQVDFSEGVNELVKVGDKVDLDTILCTIEGAVSAAAGLYDDNTRETLRRWSAMTPRAKAVGVVAKIEVYYNGEIDDMSDSLQKIVAESEKERRRSAKRLGKEYTTGLIGRSVRIDGHTLEVNQAMIMVYITTPVGMGVGDKLVFANQMKSTVGEILFGDNTTLEGETIDGIFGAKSFIDRIATSPFAIGSTNTALRYIGESAYEMYFGDEK